LPLFMFIPLRFLFHCYSLSFSITLFALILLWTPKLWKLNMHNFQQQTQTTFDNYPIFLILEHPTRHIHFFISCCLLIITWSSKLIWPVITSLCVPCTTKWKH
jgi:hypothetical protein